MSAGYRIASLVLLTTAFVSVNARAAVTVPVITSGTGTIAVDATGSYVVDCPTGCTIDLGLNNTANLIFQDGSAVTAPGIIGPTTGTLIAGDFLISENLASTSVTVTPNIGGLTATGGNYTTTAGTLTTTGGTLTLTSGATITDAGLTTGVIATGTPAPVLLMTQPQADSISALIRSGLNFVLFGSHHRILQDNGLEETGSGFWATGDYARHDPSSTNASVGEFGFYKDIDSLRLGLGAGTTGVKQARQSTAPGVSGKLDSRYVVFEINYRSIRSGWIGSATAYAGSNSATISRDYMVGATPDLSTGDASGSSFAIRLRSDWKNATTLAGLDVSPYLAYTHAESRLNAYTETGGTIPLAFAEQRVTSDELRGGVTLLSRLTEQTDMRFPLELAHRKNSSATVNGMVATIPFSFSSASSKQNWGRAGIELDHRLGPQTVLNGATIFASTGGDASWLATVSIKQAF